MIGSFKHRGLKRLYKDDDRRGIRPDLVDTVEDILGRLDRAESPQALNLPGYRLHALNGGLRGFWSVTVRENWRIIFRFEGAEVLGVSRQTLNNIIHGKSGISPEMAIRLSKAFGSTPETWLRMQLAYDL